MKNETKVRVMSGIVALMMANSIALSSPAIAYAENMPNLKEGTFIEIQVESDNVKFGQYVIKKGDNLSIVSQKICRHMGLSKEEMTTKYWPVLAFLNGFPRVIQPGDIVIFPKTMEEMDALLIKLRKSGWTSKYIQANDVYGSKKQARRTTVGELLAEIYGDSVCVDPDFVRLYLRALNLTGKYDIDSEITSSDILFDLTEWIPTLNELEEYSFQNGRGK